MRKKQNISKNINIGFFNLVSEYTLEVLFLKYYSDLLRFTCNPHNFNLNFKVTSLRGWMAKVPSNPDIVDGGTHKFHINETNDSR